MHLAIPTGVPWDDGRWAYARLQQAGHEAWFVGGCVRDLILQRPVHDVDIATSAHPHEVLACFPKVIEVGRSFGVVIAVHPSGRQLEIATFRHDGAYIDGRRPTSVVFSTAQEDVKRRDFTINGLLLHPFEETVVDHVGGLDDLHHRRLRVIEGPQRLLEDRLRVLRGLRFSAHLGLTPTAETWAALVSTSLDGLSRERIWQEIHKGLASRPAAWWKSVSASGHVPELIPCVSDHQQDIAQHLEAVTKEDDPMVALAVILAPAASPELWQWLQKEPCAREQQRRLRELCSARATLLHGCSLAVRRRLLRGPDAALLVRLLTCCGEVPEAATWLADEQACGPLPPLLTASDLLAAGIPPGPRIGQLLAASIDLQLTGALSERTAALTWALRQP
jgi:tRNA nucleotidyltransferase/poly(A) polymerase